MKSRGFATAVIVFLLLAIFTTACGKEDAVIKKGENEGPWFETEFRDFKLEDEEFVPALYMDEKAMYFVVYRVEEATGNRLMTLKKMSLEDYSTTDLKTYSSSDVGAILNICVDETSIYMTAQTIQRNQDQTKILSTTYSVILCEKDGTVRETWDITKDLEDRNSEEEAVYLSDIACDSQGNIYLTDNMTFVMAYNKQGEKIADINCDNWGNGFVSSNLGQVYYSYTSGITMKECLALVDIKANKLGKKVTETASVMNYNYCIDGNDTLWYSNEKSLITYDLNTEERREILSWIDYDITADSVRMLTVLEDGSIIACVESLLKEQLVYEVAIFKEIDQPLNDKTVITYATFGTDTDIMEGIVRFNKNSEEYRVKVVDYYDEENYEEAWNEFNQAILEEGFADVVNVGLANYEMMATKGLYADLNEFMDSDEEIHREDYFENVLKAYDVSGKLYAMPVSFTISTLAGKEKVWGNKETISLSDVEAVMKDMPKNVAIMDGMSRTDFMFFMLQGSLNKFIDWESGECNFDSEEFIEIMKLSKDFPKNSNWDIFSDETVDKFRQDKVLLYDFELSEVAEYQMLNTMLNDKLSLVGYPGANGGLIQTEGSLLAISEISDNKEIAWEFVKSMISEEYQNNYIYYSTPIHKGAFEKQLEKAMEKECYTDENGKELEMPKMTYDYNGIEIEVYAATNEDVKTYKKVVESASTLATYDQQIMAIVEEEMEAFWNNKKTAEEVSEIIQSRAKLYVAERR